ncbi:MAG: hypothetical protein J6C01_04285 [Lachnospiraceae bacterium]|nr:hypothetical protein [Lachnospiraceae bacterium]
MIRKIRRIMLRVLQLVVFVLPFILGTYGLTQIYGGNVIDAAYMTCRLYGMDADLPEEINIYVEIARWMAPFATASGVLLIIEALGKRLSNWFKRFNKNNIVVYGNSVTSELLLGNLEHRGIRPVDNKIVPAEKHVILFDTDEENIDFYTKNQNQLEGKQVYIHLNEMNQLSIKNPNLHVFSVTEIAARLFWREEAIPFDKVEKGIYRILIVGFEDLGQEVLKYGLLNNIFDPKQQLEYHIFGDTHHFFDWHRELDKMIPDRIIVHDNSVYEEKGLIAQADRIVFCGADRENMVAASNILAYYNMKQDVELYASVFDKDVLELIGTTDVIKPFASMEELCTKDYILNEKLNQDAIRTHNLYNESVTNPEWKVEWEDLSAFLRYSNISSADFNEVRRRYIDYYGDVLSREKLVAILTELEHIRWCRYHYMNNWVLGNTKDKVLHTHPCLIPFEELSKEEIDKDQVIVEQFVNEYLQGK